MVQLTDQLVQRLDERATHEGVSRSALIRDVLRAYLDRDEERDRVEQFVQGYERVPETPEELATAQANAEALVREDPWGTSP